MNVYLITGALGLALAAPTAAEAGSVFIFTRQGTIADNRPGFATVDLSTPGQFGTASASEYRGGVGVFASAASNSAADGADHIPQASASARVTDTMRVGRRDDLEALGNGLFELTVKVGVTGGVSVSQGAAPNGVPMGATASYRWGYSIGGLGGGGSVDRRVLPVCQNGGCFAREEEDQSGLGAAGTFGEVLFVRLDEVLSLVLNAEAFASGASYGGGRASGTADFGHTLRWLGVTRLRYQDPNGQFVDVPDGYRLTLTSTDGQFDYWNAAGPNPFSTGVPEPATWAMIVGGFGMLGATARRRRTPINFA